MPNYNSTLQTNNSSLEEIITQLNNMPDAGEGLDTSDATATASDILSGKTAYVKGEKITGNIAFQAAQTITPGTVDKTIAAGQYLEGAQTIKGDANLIASNIISGKSIFGVVGTAVETNQICTIGVPPQVSVEAIYMDASQNAFQDVVYPSLPDTDPVRTFTVYYGSVIYFKQPIRVSGDNGSYYTRSLGNDLYALGVFGNCALW